jgi:hypothetical protein
MSVISTPIPPPAAESGLFGLAWFSTPLGPLTVYWWDLYKSVVLHISYSNLWFIQNNGLIRDSIADIFNWESSLITADELQQFRYTSGFTGGYYNLPEDLTSKFLECEWSDYACDRRPIRGHLFERSPMGQTLELAEDEEADSTTPPPVRRRRIERVEK